MLWHPVAVAVQLLQMPIKYFATFNCSLVNTAQLLLQLNTHPCSTALSAAVQCFCLVVTDRVHRALSAYICCHVNVNVT
jgi:hypothetical protein